MSDYSFVDQVNAKLGKLIKKHGFSLNKSLSNISPGFQPTLLTFESKQCQLKIFIEHYRVYIQISALNTSDPNLWYNIDIMACYSSSTPPSEWIYTLPRGVPISQVVDQQLVRWQKILENYIDRIIPLFTSKEKLRDNRATLDAFVRNFYDEYRRVTSK